MNLPTLTGFGKLLVFSLFRLYDQLHSPLFRQLTFVNFLQYIFPLNQGKNDIFTLNKSVLFQGI